MSVSNPQHVTLKEVAQRAGVSKMTVSRVINNQGVVKASTREKIQSIINELNYRPNLNARRLAGGSALFIGLVYHNPSPGYLNKILVGALKSCRSYGHRLILEDLGQQMPYKEPEKTAEFLSQAGLDGVLITPPLSNNDKFVEALERLGVTVVRIAPGTVDKYKLRVATNDRLAAQQITEFLIDQGHRHIAFIRGPEDHPASHHRLDGFINAMTLRDIPVNQAFIAQGDFTFRSGTLATREFLALDKRPTAIFACNDDMAAGAMAGIYMAGLTIPDDISVVGYDDTELATNVWPPLTTVRQPISELSCRAVELLSAHVRGDDAAVEQARRLLDFDIVVRDSVGTLPS